MIESQWRQTPLFALHRELGATMTQFAGYEMPVRYPSGIINEHLHTRTTAGLFDVSHMGIIRLEGGTDLYANFEKLVPGDIRSMQPGAIRYSHLLNEQGGVIDDLMVMRPLGEPRKLLLVVNAAGKESDERHIRAGLGAAAKVELLQERALLALHGPQAAAVVARYCDAPSSLKFMQWNTFQFGIFGEAYVSRSGYTGEDGFEISLPADRAEALARSLLGHPEVIMAGLGARDSLRLEAGLPLYGHDLDETTTPVEAGMAWIIGKRRREQGGFSGFETIRRQLEEGPSRRLVGIRPQGKAIAREGTEIKSQGRTIGSVTSGGYGPSVQGPICMGYVEAAFAVVGTAVELIVRGHPLPGVVAALPFMPHRYVR